MVRSQFGSKPDALLGRVVDDQHAVHTCRRGVSHKGTGAVSQVVTFHRVGVAHQHDWGAGVLLAKATHHLEHLRRANTQAQRSLTCFLDHRSISHRITEGHAEFNHVGARRHQPVHQIGRHVGLWKTGHDIRDQGLAALGLEGVKGGLDAAHAVHPFTIMTDSACPLTD